MGVAKSAPGPNGEDMNDYVIRPKHFWDKMVTPYKYALPQCKNVEWQATDKMNNKTTTCITGGEKWMCKGYKTDTPGQLNKADKAERAKWKSIKELRASGELKGPPSMGYYFEDGVRKYGERHPYYGHWWLLVALFFTISC